MAVAATFCSLLRAFMIIGLPNSLNSDPYRGGTNHSVVGQVGPLVEKQPQPSLSAQRSYSQRRKRNHNNMPSSPDDDHMASSGLQSFRGGMPPSLGDDGSDMFKMSTQGSTPRSHYSDNGSKSRTSSRSGSKSSSRSSREDPNHRDHHLRKVKN